MNYNLNKITTNQPVMIVTELGTKVWELHEQFHREDGPAIIYRNGNKSWYLNGKRHRTDGPALDWDYKKEWYLNGEPLNRDDWLKALTPEQLNNYLWNIDNE